jgi:hypothetical protein
VQHGRTVANAISTRRPRAGAEGAGLEGVLIGLAVGLGTVLVIELVDDVR